MNKGTKKREILSARVKKGFPIQMVYYPFRNKNTEITATKTFPYICPRSHSWTRKTPSTSMGIKHFNWIFCFALLHIVLSILYSYSAFFNNMKTFNLHDVQNLWNQKLIFHIFDNEKIIECRFCQTFVNWKCPSPYHLLINYWFSSEWL